MSLMNLSQNLFTSSFLRRKTAVLMITEKTDLLRASTGTKKPLLFLVPGYGMP